jgi:hypothetical protein
MSSSYRYLNDHTLISLLDINKQSLAVLEVQKANYGPIGVPVAIVNQIRDILKSIEDIEAEQSKRKQQTNPRNTDIQPVTYQEDSDNRSKSHIDTGQHIMITGGINASGAPLYLALLIGQKVILRKHILISNGAGGIDDAASAGALMACRSIKADPNQFIQVFRPHSSPVAHFNFGNLLIQGNNYDDRRRITTQKSEAIILLGGTRGTNKVIEQARAFRKPVIPIGIGERGEAAVELWHEMYSGVSSTLMKINKEDLIDIGPDQKDLEVIATSAINIVEKLIQK